MLAQGTPTNTVQGEATTELGRDPGAWFPLVTKDVNQQPATISLVEALTGAAPSIPLLGGDLDHDGAQYLLVAALWNVLWGRSMRDVIGAGANERALAQWAHDNVAAQGVYPAMRVGAQPYGVLPTSALRRWVAAVGDPPVESAIREWSLPWRDAGAQAAEASGHKR